MLANENSTPAAKNRTRFGAAEYWLVAIGALVIGMLIFTTIYLSELPGF